jgi:hypothetical protein
VRQGYFIQHLPVSSVSSSKEPVVNVKVARKETLQLSM